MNYKIKMVSPKVKDKLGNAIRNNILKYKDSVNLIFIDEKVSCSLNSDLCDLSKIKVFQFMSQTYHDKILKIPCKQKA